MKPQRHSLHGPLHEQDYQYIEYESEHATVAVIHDCENEKAWIQSTVSVPVEQ